MDAHQELNRIGDDASTLANMDQTDDMLPIEVTNTTEMYLQDLNDDCLLHIFSKNCPLDLCFLAETSKRFKQIIQGVFPKEFDILKSHNSASGRYTIRWKNYSQLYCEQDVERILKIFGSRLSTLSIGENQAFVDLIAKHCGDVTLKRLELCGMKIDDGIVVRLKPIFERLAALDIVGSTVCDDAILKNNFPNLERFTCRDVMFDYNTGRVKHFVGRHKRQRILESEGSSVCCYNTGAISQFIGRHKRLRILQLEGSSLCCSAELLHSIGHNCKELEELSLRRLNDLNIPFDTLNPPILTNLRNLYVDINNANYIYIIALLRALPSLETVKLNFVFSPIVHQVFDVLSQLQRLRELCLCASFISNLPWTVLPQLTKLSVYLGGFFRITDIFDIIGQMTNLEELEFDNGYGNEDVFTGRTVSVRKTVLRESDYAHILKIAESRSNVLTLKCRYNFSAICDENVKVRLTK